jgi:hypothetical protein
VAYHARIEALSKDIQHRAVFRQHLSHEMRDPTFLGDSRQPLNQDRPEAATVEVIGDLDRDFRTLLIELDVGGVTDEHARLVMCDQPVVLRVRGGR